MVLDVLDDVRHNVLIDPDRTYIAGISGGGRIACIVGFALPGTYERRDARLRPAATCATSRGCGSASRTG